MFFFLQRDAVLAGVHDIGSAESDDDDDGIDEELALLNRINSYDKMASKAKAKEECDEERDVFDANRPVLQLQQQPQPRSLGGSPHPQQKTQAEEATDSKKGMSRSISDSTLRRAALHLNLNQSVLPSFTSLQQFKVGVRTFS